MPANEVQLQFATMLLQQIEIVKKGLANAEESERPRLIAKIRELEQEAVRYALGRQMPPPIHHFVLPVPNEEALSELLHRVPLDNPEYP